MRRIAIEEHFYTEGYMDYLRSREGFPKLDTADDPKRGEIERLWRTPTYYQVRNPLETSRLLDTGEGRLNEMDKAGIDMHVLSLAGPGVEMFDVRDGTTMARETNDELGKIIKTHPERFAGLAALAPQDPSGAAEELERAVKELGLVGAKINSHVGGEYLDDRKYWAIFGKAEELGVPIYIHPREPSPDMIKPFEGYPGLPRAMWGYGAEVGLHTMRLICSGLFDEYPSLKIILGHLGEALPFWLWRIDNHWRRFPMAEKLDKKPSEYFADNFVVTTSGMFSLPAFLCTYLSLGDDSILFAVDHPYESSKEAVEFMDGAPISHSAKEKIYHLNAERLFKL